MERRPGGARPPTRRRLHRSALALGTALAVTWGAGAYLVLPAFLSHRDYQPALALKPLTRTHQGIHGDPINVGLVGSKTEILESMNAAGWHPADAVTLLSSFKIGISVVLDRAYPAAPISNLFYEGRAQDLGFERAEGRSAKRRHHVRFWLTLGGGVEGRPVWLGAASFDRGVGLSRYTLQVTHRVAPDLDAERDLLIADLTRAHRLGTVYSVDGVGPTLAGRNGGGDPYFTDGDVTIGVLTKGNRPQAGTPTILPEPSSVIVGKTVWHGLHDALRRSGILGATSGD